MIQRWAGKKTHGRMEGTTYEEEEAEEGSSGDGGEERRCRWGSSMMATWVVCGVCVCLFVFIFFWGGGVPPVYVVCVLFFFKGVCVRSSSGRALHRRMIYAMVGHRGVFCVCVCVFSFFFFFF